MADDRMSTQSEPQPLPASAPKVRITAGFGTLNQRTWILRRPATLIGTGKQAHLVLSHPDISRAHCLIVNTGSAVLLKDLHSKSGTRCKDRWVDLAALVDGDVLRVGDAALQVAISCEQTPDESSAGIVFSDPLALPQPLELRREDGTSWRLETAVTVLGRSPGAEIRLDHPEVSLVHAALFAVGGELAVADLDSRTGVTVNGEKRASAVVKPGDRLGIGPFVVTLVVTLVDPRGARVERRPAIAPPCRAEAGPGEALERLREELDHRTRELEQKAASLEREHRVIESARHSLEMERGALLRQSAALRDLEIALDTRRRSLEQREKALRESLLRQAHGALSAAGTCRVPPSAINEPPMLAAAPN